MIQNIIFMIQLQYVHHHAKTMEYAQHPIHVLVVILDMKELIVEPVGYDINHLCIISCVLPV